MNTGEAIRYYRKKNKLTQDELAKLCGTSSGMIRQYELGIRNPKIETIEKISQALNIRIADIYPISFNEWKDTGEAKILERNSNSYYTIIKLLELIYGRAESVSVDGYKDDELYYSSNYISVGIDDKRIAIENEAFTKIITLCKNQLKDIVDLIAKDENAFLSNWQHEDPKIKLVFSEDEHVKVTIENEAGTSYSRPF